MAIHHKILGVATLLYLLIFFLHVLYFSVKKEKILSVTWITIYGTFCIHTLGLVLRWIESYRMDIGHVPLANFYESLIFFAWSITLVLIIMRRKIPYPAITMCASTASLFLMGYASISPSVEKGIQPLIPALQSNWLHIHVVTCFLAYSAFVISFICGALYFITWEGVVPPKETLDDINYRSVIIGFPMLSVGILTGAVWAHYAWGSYWSWDPKETWSLITWIIYALFLHARLVRGWRERRIALISIIGFMSVIFTYFGVNIILSGLHAYAI